MLVLLKGLFSLTKAQAICSVLPYAVPSGQPDYRFLFPGFEGSEARPFHAGCLKESKLHDVVEKHMERIGAHHPLAPSAG
jgi:hypothetical protein